MYLEIALVLLSSAVFGIVIMLIPLAVQLNRFIKTLSQALEQINRDLPGVMQNINEISSNLRTSTLFIRHRMEALDLALGKFQSLLGILYGFEGLVRPFLRLPAFRFLRTTGAVIKGIRVFAKVIKGKDKP